MKRQRHVFSLLLAVLASPGTMSASQSNGPASLLSRPVEIPSWQADKKNPYGRLFQPAQGSFALAKPAADKPETKCTMTMIPADPSLDPLIAISRPPDGTKFTMRVIPPACR